MRNVVYFFPDENASHENFRHVFVIYYLLLFIYRYILFGLYKLSFIGRKNRLPSSCIFLSVSLVFSFWFVVTVTMRTEINRSVYPFTAVMRTLTIMVMMIMLTVRAIINRCTRSLQNVGIKVIGSIIAKFFLAESPPRNVIVVKVPHSFSSFNPPYP